MYLHRKPVAELTPAERQLEIDGYLALFRADEPAIASTVDGILPRIPAEALALSVEERCKEVAAWYHPYEIWALHAYPPAPAADRPTFVAPGEDKLPVLMLRAKRRQQLFHRSDRPASGRTPTIFSLVAETPPLLSEKDLEDLKKIRAVAARVTHGLRVVRPTEEEGGVA